MSFSRKWIDVQFSLAGGGGQPSEPIRGKRVIAKINNAGGQSQGVADVTIYGMTLSDMNRLSAVGKQINMVNKNKIKIIAGEDDGSDNGGVVFEGDIVRAYVDANSQPMVAFRVAAVAAGYPAVQKMDPTSVEGSADVAETIEKIAKKAGFQFENNGVKVKVSNPYLYGSPLEQIRSIVQAAGIQWTVENGTLAIWKTGGSRNGESHMFSPETGMVGYPVFSEADVIVTKTFDRTIGLGHRITVQSQLEPANGEWAIYNVTHDISAETPNGPWFTQVMALRADAGSEGGIPGGSYV